MPDFRYEAFISYSHEDERWARWLHRSLEGYRLPGYLDRSKLRPIFRDRDELPVANDLGEKIQQALEQSKNLIVICSPAAGCSPWVNAEVGHIDRAAVLFPYARHLETTGWQAEGQALFEEALDIEARDQGNGG